MKYKMTLSDMELQNMDSAELNRRINEFGESSGVTYVSSGKMQEVHFMDRSEIEIHAYFDSFYWTGRSHEHDSVAGKK